MKQPQCHCGKIAYGSSREATRVLDRIRRRKKDSYVRELYQCGEGLWHIGRRFGDKRTTKPMRSNEA